MRTVRSVLMVSLLATAVGAACSMMLTFEEENRPCGPDESPSDGLGDCSDGYSCMVNVCVENRSVSVGNTCSVNAHCEEGHTCTTSPFICRKECEHAFGNAECAPNEACLAMTDADGAPVGACGTSNCDASPCGGVDTVCVSIKPNVGHCMDGCSINCTGIQCDGDCRFGSNSEARACQPVGPDDTLACVPEGDRTQGRGCNLLGLAFCDESHACIMPAGGEFGVCIKYCNPAELDPCPGLTDPSKSPAQPAECNEVLGKGFAICGTLPSGPTTTDGGPTGGDTPTGGDPVAPSGPKRCQESCIADADCDAGNYCVGSRCVSCADDDDCVADGSYFLGDSTDHYCTVDGDCSSGVCVTEPTSGANWCTSEYSPFVGCFNHGVIVSLEKADSSGPVDVCVNSNWVCRDDWCVWECATDSDCAIRASGWYNTCSVAGDCTGTLCIDADGAGDGRCATDASISGCFGNQVSVSMTLMEGGTADVCADQTQTCDIGGTNLCTPPTDPPPDRCTGDPDCDPGSTGTVAYPVCEDPGTTTGVCVCDATSCVNSDGHPNCTSDGQCECNDANDCDTALTAIHHNTTWVCE